MAITFNGTSDFATLAGNAAYGPGSSFSVSLWMYLPTGWVSSSFARILEVGGANGTDFKGYSLTAHSTGSNVRWDFWDIDARNVAFWAPSLDTWIHIAATLDGSGNGEMFENAVSKGTRASIGSTAQSTNGPIFGAGTGGASNFGTPIVAEYAVYSEVLPASAIASLARGYSPLLVRPEKLNAYAPLIRGSGAGDVILGGSLTLSGTSNAAHPRVIYPRRRSTSRGASAPAITIPRIVHHRKMQGIA